MALGPKSIPFDFMYFPGRSQGPADLDEGMSSALEQGYWPLEEEDDFSIGFATRENRA